MWDPCLIISQIVAVQCVFYLFLAFWILLVDFWTGSARSLDQFFRPKVNTTDASLARDQDHLLLPREFL